ncbi:DNA replication complex GINS protein Sld5p [Trichomonascus vanleenenianus]|uniref:DNA replication protein SLD5 n=1 Tax=Trichomonascus vanleenenianus TaxID=2268995 RepID=UPI003EC97D65
MGDNMDIDDIIQGVKPDRPANVPRGEVLRRDLADLNQIWMKERMIPEILPFETDLLERIMKRVRQKMEYIEENTLEMQGRDIKLKLLIVESELERVKFLIRGYLRARLAKIDKYTHFYKTNSSERRKLSQKEIEYMDRHHLILRELYKSQFLSAMPEQLQRLDDKSGGISMIEEPDLEKVVFIRVKRDVGDAVRLGPEDEVELKKGNIYALRYSVISRYVAIGDVEVI